jgi:glycosyltransferase involved in cell wall biosynthesis
MRSNPSSTSARLYSLIVHSHLRWDFVWQRPQQLLSRMAARHPVLFVEEPVFSDDRHSTARLEVTMPVRDVIRVVPCLPATLRHRYDAAIVTVRQLTQELIGEGGDLAGRFDDAVQWFYTPMPAPAMMGAFNEQAIVYDCMDELAQFRFAPADLVERERCLLSRADVVFTGGRRLWEAKRLLHSNVHFFGCGVDVQHYAGAVTGTAPVPDDIAALPGPICGYVGVIDERLDYPLLATLADRLPHASIVMIGPIVKVDPAELPQRPNLHWLGRRDYSALPGYLSRFDVALMPFALNEATEYINPTKTLEYMAAGRSIVSTAVSDVVRHFEPIVTVARSHDRFVDAVRDNAAVPDLGRIARGRRRAAGASWDAIVRDMGSRISAVIDRADDADDADDRTAGARLFA